MTEALILTQNWLMSSFTYFKDMNLMEDFEMTDTEEALRITAEEAAKAKEVALTQGESSNFDLAPPVLKTLEELQKEQHLMRDRLD